MKNDKAKKNALWERQIEELERFVRRQGFEVFIENDPDGLSTFDPETKEIIVHNRQKLESQFYCLIHEIGHLLIAKNYRRYQKTLCYTQKFSAKTQVYKVSEIEEEFEAWRLGYQRAKKLRFYINNKNFERLKARYITSYFEWALDSRIKKKIQQAFIEQSRDNNISAIANKIVNKRNPIIAHKKRKKTINGKKSNPAKEKRKSTRLRKSTRKLTVI